MNIGAMEGHLGMFPGIICAADRREPGVYGIASPAGDTVSTSGIML
jgi:hypothetical protein